MKKLFKILSASLSVLFAAFQFASAQTDGGEEALGFSRVTMNPKAAAMGFAGVASTTHPAWSSFSNAAVIPFCEQKFDFQGTYQGWATDNDDLKATRIAVGASYKLGKFAFTLAYAHRNDANEYTIVDDSGNERGTFKPKGDQFNVGLAYGFSERFSVGANVKFLKQSLSDDDDYSSVATDIFLMGRFSDFTVALGASNIGGSVEDSQGESFKIPSSVTLGGNYSKKFAEQHGIEADLDLDYFFSGNFTAAFGAEYSFKDMVFARAGYHYGADKAVLPSFATLGLGLKLYGIRLDFAFLTANDDIGNGFTLGFGYQF